MSNYVFSFEPFFFLIQASPKPFFLLLTLSEFSTFELFGWNEKIV